MKTISNSTGETEALGESLAKTIKPGDVVALIGELGSGKTVFTKGIARGIGVKDARHVNSPTFVIIKEYRGRMPLYHFDLYRLAHPNILDENGFDEYFYGDGVCVIEWADKIPALLPAGRIEVTFKAPSSGKRIIAIRDRRKKR